ncbi:MAG TPA: sensor histidine kinase [Ktedonobacteraceae bacterium]|nr:sensor histidine kinase [Ktedonobacteraceae bacterium]
MSKPLKLFRARTIPDATLRRLRSTPSYFFLIWRWSMWLYALVVIVSFKMGTQSPFYNEKHAPLTFAQMAALLLAITFVQTLIITLYAPVFQMLLPRFIRQRTVPAGQQQKHKRSRTLAEHEEAQVVPPLLYTRNAYWDIAIYGLDMVICGLVTYYSGPFSIPPFGVGSPFYRYGISTAFAAALAYRYRGGLATALGYDLFIIFGMLVPAPGGPLHYQPNMIDIAGSLIDAPIAAILAAYFATLLGKYAQSKKDSQETTRRLLYLARVGETLMKGTNDRQELLQRSVAQIRQGGHFGRLVIALISIPIDEEESQNPQPEEISTCVTAETILPNEQLPTRSEELIRQVLSSKQKFVHFEPLRGDNNVGYGIARMYLPLHKDGLVQIIIGAESRRTTPFGGKQEEFLTIAGTQLSVALDNIRLAEQMVQLAAAAERGRIAREIHDGIAQLTYMLSLQAETCEAQAQRIAEASEEDADLITPLAQRLGKLVTLSKQALWETRTYMFSLKPLMSGTTTLTEMLTNQLREFEAISDLKTSLEIDGAEQALSGNHRRARHYAQVGTAFFRIVQEALTNTYKHAEATEIQVRLHFKPDSIAVEVSDNGRGLPVSNSSYDLSTNGSHERIYSGRGLDGMRDRAQEMGGTFEVLSQPASGVTVQVCLPL